MIPHTWAKGGVHFFWTDDFADLTVLYKFEIRIRLKRCKFFFSLLFVRIHTNEFIQLLYKLYSTNSYMVWFLYQFIHFYTNCIVQRLM